VVFVKLARGFSELAGSADGPSLNDTYAYRFERERRSGENPLNGGAGFASLFVACDPAVEAA
jgi:hypothetical protein